MDKIQKKAFTLLEIMIVIFLIGTIVSVVGYNMKGSLDKGKVFKTEQAKRQIQDILLLAVAQGASLQEVVANPETYLKNSGLISDVDKLLKDGWGKRMQILADEQKQTITVQSESLQRHEGYKVPENDKEDDSW